MTAIGRRTADGGGAATEGWPQRGAKGARIGWDGGGLAAKKRKKRKNRMGRRKSDDGQRRTEEGGAKEDGRQTAWRRRVGRKEAQKAQESDGTAENGGRRAEGTSRMTDGGRI
jgi:hypothetical protein